MIKQPIAHNQMLPSAAVSHRSHHTPIVASLTGAFVGSFAIAILIAVSAAVGLLYQSAMYPTREAWLAFVPSDAFNLVVSLPVLLGTLWLAQRGRLIGLLCWPGALFVVLYMYLPYTIGAPLGVLFPVHLALVALSTFTLIDLVACIDGAGVRQRLDGIVPARTAGGILVGLAIVIIVRQAVVMVGVITSHASVALLERATWIVDVVVAVPALLLGGVLLWRRRALGYVVGAGLLLGYGLLALSVIPFFVVQARASAVPLDVGGVIAMLVMTGICLAPFALFVRGAAERSKSHGDD